ncbi:MAG: PEGA domain-containing protein, partial [Deltaproteobacteria bacterium]|nr:PEGA domain-containing protein [Deltaproteobacteria bacterium]
RDGSELIAQTPSLPETPPPTDVLPGGADSSDEIVIAEPTTLAPASSPAMTVTRVKPDPLIGSVMEGRYEILGRIGAGGMGVVYKARQTTMDRIVAVKVLLRSLASNDSNVRRFQLEARAASRLNHPNTITIHDFGQTKDGTLYIAMEFLDGESLDRVLALEKRLDPVRVVRIMVQVCRSLAEAHAAGIIHRDLKPDNIFLNRINSEPDFVKVLDFGVAKLKDPGTIGDGSGTLTQAGMIFGTPKYMSPEQAQSLELDPRSDIYSLGIIIYELLCGRPPFTGEAPLSILIKHVHEPPPPPSRFTPPGTIPPALEAVVVKALQKDRNLRQASATALRLELEEALLAFSPPPPGSQVLMQVGSVASQAALLVALPTSPEMEPRPGPPTPPGGSLPQLPGYGYYPPGYVPPTTPSIPQASWDFSTEEGERRVHTPSGPGGGRRLTLTVGAVLVAAVLAGGIWVARSRVSSEPQPGTAATVQPGGSATTAALPAALVRADGGAPRPGEADGGVIASAGEVPAAAGADGGGPPQPEPADGKMPGRPDGARGQAEPSRQAGSGGRKPGPGGSAGDVRPTEDRDRVKLRLSSTPPGASVYVNGIEYVGLTPTTIQRKRGIIPVTLTFRKTGFQDVQTIVDLRSDQDVQAKLLARTGTASLPVEGGSAPPPPGPTPAPPRLTPPSSPAQAQPAGTGQGAPGFGKFGDFKTLKFED